MIKRNNKNELLLSGMIKCFECGKRIAFQKSNNSIYTICNTYKKYSKYNLCTTHSNNYNDLEKRIIMELKRIIDNRIEINRETILLLIKRIELHKDKSIDIIFNFKSPFLSLK